MTKTASDFAAAFDAGQLRDFLARQYVAKAQSGRRYDLKIRRTIDNLGQAIAAQTGLSLDEIHADAQQDAQFMIDKGQGPDY